MELKPEGLITLPAPKTTGETSVEEALFSRRSVRTYTKEPITPGDLSRLLWAAQGVTAGQGAGMNSEQRRQQGRYACLRSMWSQEMSRGDAAADVSDDGRVTSLDAPVIMRAAVGNVVS
jgi:hypothetical protein